MVIPFMPSVCSVYRSWVTPVLRHADVPCRVVPRYWGGRRRANSPVELQFTHWVDLARVSDMVASVVPSGLTTMAYELNTVDASFLVVPSLHPRHVFLVLAVEDRYIDTLDVHMRVYVQARPRVDFP